MTRGAEIRAAVLRLLEVFDREALDYALMGGLVVPVWGIPRATFDVDVVLSANEDEFRRFVAGAVDAGFQVDPPFASGFRDTIRGMEKGSLEWWTPAGRRVEVDVFLVTTPYQREALRRRVEVMLAGRKAWVIGPADLVLHKLMAGRPKDLADVDNVFGVQGLVDPDYLREWSRRLGTEARLDAAIQRLDGGAEAQDAP